MSSIDERWLAYSRLVRPFPVKRLADVMYYVEADAAAIHETLQRVTLDPPATADEWRGELDRLEGLLVSLQARCGDVLPSLGVMADHAEGDYQRAMDALVKMLRGLQAEVDQAPTLRAA